MRILQIHKYFSRQRGGGSVSAFFETKKLLEKRGHQVIVFSMQDESNEASEYSRYFVSHFDINQTKNFPEKVRLALRSIHNREAQKKLEQLIQDTQPEVAHIHNIYHYLTPAIFFTLKKHNIPIVFKLSDYKIICPNYKLFTEGKICERCRGGKYYNAVRHKCLKNSYAVSAVAMLEAYYHRWKKSYDLIDRFLAPSNFMIEKVSSFGFPREKMTLLRNVLNFFNFQPSFAKENYFAYVGRISEEKGLNTLLEAVAILQKENNLFNHKLLIVGQGPEEENLKKLARQLKIEKLVKIKGFLPKNSPEWVKLFQKARFTVLPSIWYDNSPVAISESMAFGTPVIVSHLGGTPEMIEDGKSGLVFQAGQAEDLAEKIKTMLSDLSATGKMGEKAVERVKEINNEEKYYQKLIQVYQEVINNHK